VADEYDGDASRLWTEAKDAKDLERRIRAHPGFGDMKVLALSAVLAATAWRALIPPARRVTRVPDRDRPLPV